MNWESLEKVENISPSEIVQETTEPLKDNPKEVEEYHSASLENIESFHSPLETTEIVTDREMTEGIANYLENVKEIKYENWNTLSLEQKAEVLNRIEHQVAAIEHRPPLKVNLEQMDPKTLGYQCDTERRIALNSTHVASNNPNVHREVIDTIIHEGRHAYQHYNVDTKLIHESGAEVATWRENFYDPRYRYYHATGQKIIIPYNDGSLHNVDFRLYYYQPVEIDARNFSKDVMSRLEHKGIFSTSIGNHNTIDESNNHNSAHLKSENSISFKGNERLKLPPLNAELTEETKYVLEFNKKMENQEVGPNDELKGTTEGYLIFDWSQNKLFSPQLACEQINVYKDAGTGRMFIQESQGYMAPLKKTNLWKSEGFSYSYQNALGKEIAIKKF